MTADFLALDELDAGTIDRLLARAGVLARAWAERRMPASLADRRIALVVDDGGWRNTTAFELGIAAMGGICVRAPVTLSGKEAVADLAAYLDNWFDAIVVRTPDLSRLRALAAAAKAPVINARTRSNHPCETLGDLAWLHATGRALAGLRVVVVAPQANILASWVEAAAVLPIDLVQVYPAAWHGPPAPRVRRATDPAEIDGADVVITDCWPPGGVPARLAPYRITSAMLDRLAPGAAFLPCPPVMRGEEITPDAIAHPTCQVVAAKAYLLHAQNALLEWVLPR